MWQEIWTTIVSEFSDVPDLSTMTRIVLRLVLAAILGGIIGYERELKASSAGVRTHMLVAVGAALFVLAPLQSGMDVGDMSRVLQGVIQGVGFLGAGAIMIRSGQKNSGADDGCKHLGDCRYRSGRWTWAGINCGPINDHRADHIGSSALHRSGSSNRRRKRASPAVETWIT
jgi:hypothetical protein